MLATTPTMESDNAPVVFSDDPVTDPLPVLTSLDQFNVWSTCHGDHYVLTFYHVTPDDRVFWGKSTESTPTGSLSSFIEELFRLPDDDAFPPYTRDLKMVPADYNMSNACIKRPRIHLFGSGREAWDTVDFSCLARMLQRPSIARCPYIVPYRGCRVARRFITGLVFDDRSFLPTLHEFKLMPEFCLLRFDVFLSGVRTAIEAIHAGGFAHNRINPHTIRVARDGSPILMDVDQAQFFGDPILLSTVPVPGERGPYVSDSRNDTLALVRLREWLMEPM